MCSWLGRTVSACWRPLSRYARMSKDEEESVAGESDALMWCRDLEKHPYGEFSFAVVQANQVIEDQSQVETGQDATFVGVYDGHGGPEAARFICDHLFLHLLRLAQETGTISETILRNAFSATEDGFLSLVRRAYAIKPLIASIGSCCLVGVIWKGTLFIANLGDSRAVIGSLGSSNKIVAEQLTKDHNASVEEVRQELRSLHPDDSHVVVLKNGVWRIKGIIQAVEIVHNNPRHGIARRLIKSALSEAAKKREMRYEDLKKVEKGIRRFFHDDITVVVMFIDQEMLEKNRAMPGLSVRGFIDTVGPSNFNILQPTDPNA